MQRFGGFVAKYMGDEVLIYFGYPQAHEDDAERTARAGLDYPIESLRMLIPVGGDSLQLDPCRPFIADPQICEPCIVRRSVRAFLR